MSWKTHGATPRDNTQKVANATVTNKSNMPSMSEPLIHVCLYKGSCWVGTLGTARHKASLPPPPHRRHGTARHKTGRHTEIPTPPLRMPTAPCSSKEILSSHTLMFCPTSDTKYAWRTHACNANSSPLQLFRCWGTPKHLPSVAPRDGNKPCYYILFQLSLSYTLCRLDVLVAMHPMDWCRRLRPPPRPLAFRT